MRARDSIPKSIPTITQIWPWASAVALMVRGARNDLDSTGEFPEQSVDDP